jgi:hypothetical protein
VHHPHLRAEDRLDLGQTRRDRHELLGRGLQAALHRQREAADVAAQFALHLHARHEQLQPLRVGIGMVARQLLHRQRLHLAHVVHPLEPRAEVVQVLPGGREPGVELRRVEGRARHAWNRGRRRRLRPRLEVFVLLPELGDDLVLPPWVDGHEGRGERGGRQMQERRR